VVSDEGRGFGAKFLDVASLMSMGASRDEKMKAFWSHDPKTCPYCSNFKYPGPCLISAAYYLEGKLSGDFKQKSYLFRAAIQNFQGRVGPWWERNNRRGYVENGVCHFCGGLIFKTTKDSWQHYPTMNKCCPNVSFPRATPRQLITSADAG
jgi:hypothetical protein